MADIKDENFEINLEKMGLDEGETVNDLAALLSESEEKKSITTDADSINILDELPTDSEIDFNDFSIDDLDTALKQYEVTTPETTAAVENKIQATPAVEAKNEVKKEPDVTPAQFVMPEPVVEKTIVSQASTPPATVSMPTPKKSAYSQVTEDDMMLKNLKWCDGTLGEKVYEISLQNMPEFLDYDKSIKTLHVNIDSAYGWNVFFDNGVFMNLMDVKEFQERNGSLPGMSGKIIYGNKTMTFERIEKIIVYEKPRYFSYNIG